jgi:hypothetical protein
VIGSTLVLGILMGSGSAQGETKTVTETKTVEVAGTIPQTEIDKYVAQGKLEERREGEAALDAQLKDARAEGVKAGREQLQAEQQAAADKAAQAAAAAAVGPGTLVVGQDIQPGRYRTEAGTGLDSCYWARLSSVSGDFDAIIANGNAEGVTTVEIAPSDVAFETACSWTKAG